MVSSTLRSASRLPATASATTASRCSPEIVIVGDLSSVTCRTLTGGQLAQLNNNFQDGVLPSQRPAHTPPRDRTVSAEPSRMAITSPLYASRCRYRPARTPTPSAAGSFRDVRCRSARCPRPAGSCPGHRRSTTPQPGRPRISRRVVPSRAPRLRTAPLGVLDGRRALAAGHGQFRGHPGHPHVQPRRYSSVTRSAARCSARSDAANRPTPSASAASPISASAPASGSGPAAPTPGRPSARARSCQPSCRRNDARVLWASEPTGPAARGAQCGEIGQRAAVAALAAGRRRLAATARVGSSRRAAASARGRRPNAALRQHGAVEVVIGAATLSTRRAIPGTGGHVFSRASKSHWLTVGAANVNSM